MKKTIQLFAKLFAPKKSVVTSEDPEPNTNPKKELWKFILQTAISILTAILTALGASSCVHHMI